MVVSAEVGSRAARTLAVIRLVNGALGLLVPGLLVRRTSANPHDTAPYYAFRMFGIRTVVLGADLLLLRGEAQRRARSEAVLIHASDTVCAAVGAIRGDLPARAGRLTVAISAVNTVLALLAREAAVPDPAATVPRDPPGRGA